MTQAQAIHEFLEMSNSLSIPALLKERDRGWLVQEWSMYIDNLQREKKITSKQADTWVNPFFRHKNIQGK